MTVQHDAATRAALDRLLAENGLGRDRKLYRETIREALTPTDDPGVFRIVANPHPAESVVDVYGQGHLIQAETAGPGLAFAETASPNWQETMEMRAFQTSRMTGAHPINRVEVEVRLEDILSQGGLLYPVESVTVERAWYCTLPSGSIAVRELA